MAILTARFKIDKLKFDVPSYRKALEEDLHDAMLKIAVVWIRTALHSVEGSFPVVTGMARASFANLVEYLRSQGKRIAFNLLDDVQYDRVIPFKKSVTEGRRQSKKDNFIVVFRNQYGPFKYTFDWWTSVEHFLYNETHEDAQARFNLIHPTPWKVAEQANEAAQKYLPTALRQIRKLKDYVGKESFEWEIK